MGGDPGRTAIKPVNQRCNAGSPAYSRPQKSKAHNGDWLTVWALSSRDRTEFLKLAVSKGLFEGACKTCLQNPKRGDR